MQQVIRKYADISTDFPANGVITPDVCTVMIVTPAAVTVDYMVSMDTPEDIAAGTAEWFTKTTVAASTVEVYASEYGPTGVKLVASAAGAKAWIKS